MDKSELHQHIRGVLQRHGVSPCEDSVLGIVYYGINFPPLGTAEYAKLYDDNEGNPDGTFLLEDYLRAVDSCIQRGWLTVLTPEHFEREARRQQLSSVPEVVDTCYRPGDVDFTEAGFSFHRTLLQEMFGADFLQREYSGANWDERRGGVDGTTPRGQDFQRTQLPSRLSDKSPESPLSEESLLGRRADGRGRLGRVRGADASAGAVGRGRG